ncbi:phage capsid protein [Paraburkholderia fungorum]|uniref:phage capsid protein n=1 Tax=Paraburkholderia fungorum TaxID=134537 RepID=UPI003877F7CC
MHGMILKPSEVDYSDLDKFGRITIEHTSRGVEIEVDGFEFAEGGTCRQHNAKALAWARDVLAAKIAANSLVPGGFIISIANMDQDQLEQERAEK